MKIRSGFVSNSSSSSFICDVCGRDEAGFDCSLSDFDMCSCENDHIFCIEHAINTDSKDYEKYFEENEMPYDFNSYIDRTHGCDILKKYCPICNFEIVSRDDANSYMMKKLNFESINDVIAEIKENFESYDKFRSYIEEK